MGKKSEKPTVLTGKAVVLKTNEKMINSIDTDMIFHNKYLHITDINEMGQYALDNLEGWEDFAKRIKNEEWKFLITGKNFGSGSSRQHAVDCFKDLGINAIIGESFGAIYKRNTINSGMPLVQLENFDINSIETGDELELNLEKGTLLNKNQNKQVAIIPFSNVQLDIYFEGDIFAYGRKLE